MLKTFLAIVLNKRFSKNTKNIVTYDCPSALLRVQSTPDAFWLFLFAQPTGFRPTGSVSSGGGSSLVGCRLSRGSDLSQPFLRTIIMTNKYDLNGLEMEFKDARGFGSHFPNPPHCCIHFKSILVIFIYYDNSSQPHWHFLCNFILPNWLFSLNLEKPFIAPLTVGKGCVLFQRKRVETQEGDNHSLCITPNNPSRGTFFKYTNHLRITGWEYIGMNSDSTWRITVRNTEVYWGSTKSQVPSTLGTGQVPADTHNNVFFMPPTTRTGKYGTTTRI